MKVFIDPGHGNRQDAGVLGEHGIREADVCLCVALHAKQALEEQGHQVLLFRDWWTGYASQGLRNQACTRAANEFGADYFVAVHCGGSGKMSISGGRAFVKKKGGADHKLAYKLLLELEKLGIKNRGVYIDKKCFGRPLQVLEGLNMPAAVTEVGFLTNATEERSLALPQVQKNIGQAVANTVLSIDRESIMLPEFEAYDYNYRQNNGGIHTVRVWEIDPAAIGAQVIQGDELERMTSYIGGPELCDEGQGVLVSDGQVQTCVMPHILTCGYITVTREGQVVCHTQKPDPAEVKFAVGGLLIFPDCPKLSGAVDESEYLEEEPRIVLGYNRMKNRILAVAYDKMSPARGRNILGYLGCEFGISLAHGFGALMKEEGRQVLRGDNRKTAIIIPGQVM